MNASEGDGLHHGRRGLAAVHPVAYLIGRAQPRWRSLLLMAVMVPFWTMPLVSFAIIYWLVNRRQRAAIGIT